MTVLTLIASLLGPLLAYRAVRSAARFGDRAALSQLVDYDAVRASLKPQLIDPVGARAVPPAPNPLTDPLGALRNAWTQQTALPAIRNAPAPDSYLSPDGLLLVIAGRADASAPPKLAPAGKVAVPAPSLAYFGLHRARLLVRGDADRDRATVLTFARGRDWFQWRLVGLTLPTHPGDGLPRRN